MDHGFAVRKDFLNALLVTGLLFGALRGGYPIR
jgi:hypothetical protein